MRGILRCPNKQAEYLLVNQKWMNGSMAKYTKYLWREVPSDNCWRIQTTDPSIKSKLRRGIVQY